MRIFLLYTILSLFCFTSATAQEVPFEGLHLDDLISIPGERKPGIINHPVSVFKSSDFKLLPSSGHAYPLYHSLPVETYSSTTVRAGVEPRYRLTDRVSLYVSVNYLSERYRTPHSLYTRGAGVGVIYQLSDRLLWKSGTSYQYNTVLRKWEWIYMTGFIFCF